MVTPVASAYLAQGAMPPKGQKYNRDALLRIAALSVEEALRRVGQGLGLSCEYLGVSIEGSVYDLSVTPRYSSDLSLAIPLYIHRTHYIRMYS